MGSEDGKQTERRRKNARGKQAESVSDVGRGRVREGPLLEISVEFVLMDSLTSLKKS